MQFSTGTSAPTAAPADPNLPAQFYNSASKFTYNWDLGSQAWRAIPKVWRALLSQEGTASPTAFVTENTLLTSLAWQRNGAGTYFAIPTPAYSFTDGRTGVTMGPLSSGPSGIQSGSIRITMIASILIIIETFDLDGDATDGLLVNTEFAMSVYPE